MQQTDIEAVGINLLHASFERVEMNISTICYPNTLSVWVKYHSLAARFRECDFSNFLLTHTISIVDRPHAQVTICCCGTEIFSSAIHCTVQQPVMKTHNFLLQHSYRQEKMDVVSPQKGILLLQYLSDCSLYRFCILGC